MKFCFGVFIIIIYKIKMKKSEYQVGEFLYGIPSSMECASYNPKDKRVFIHDGTVTPDGYGILVGWNDGVLKKSTGYGNFCWGDSVRKATPEEIVQFIRQLHQQDVIRFY